MKRIMLLCVTALAPGCTSFSPAPEGRGSLEPPPPLRAEDWPARDVDAVGGLMAPGAPMAAPEELYTVQPAAGPGEARVMSAAGTPLSRVAYNGPAGQGLLRVYDDEGALSRDGARFVSSWTLRGPDRAEAEARARMFERTGERLLSTTTPAPDEPRSNARSFNGAVRFLDGDGVSMALPRTGASPSVRRWRGLVVYFDGVVMRDAERPLLRELEARGWAVVRINTVTAMRRDPAPVRVPGDSEVRAPAAEIAAGVDDALAENAYAAEAALEYLAIERPDVPQRPLVLVGCSTGACAVPVAAARLGDRVDAAILVGGGANMLDIALRSDATNLGIEVDWAATVAPVARATDLLVEYLKATRLDPYHTARHLSGTPVLTVHAVFDGVIPASSGRLLHARLGNPDRLRFSGGQTAMLRMMQDIAPQIATWLDSALYDDPAGGFQPAAVRHHTPAPAAAARPEPVPELNAPDAPKAGGAKRPAVIDLD